jgi:glycerophosphoryl diester phosphodiesterase
VASAEQCDVVEFDVRFSAEGAAVIVHDETLDRLFGVPRRVSELSVHELAEIGVPTLSNVLAAMPATTLIDLELKELPTDSLFAAIVGARGASAEGIVLSSFHPAVLRRVEERAPSWPRWLNAETAAEAEHANALGCVGLSVSMELLNDANISSALEQMGSKGMPKGMW